MHSAFFFRIREREREREREGGRLDWGLCEVCITMLKDCAKIRILKKSGVVQKFFFFFFFFFFKHCLSVLTNTMNLKPICEC